MQESGTGTGVDLWGEFDIFSLRDLREALTDVSTHRRPALVDLSGITFLDLQSAREFAVRSLLYAGRLSLGNPSPEALASIKALGLEGWVCIEPPTPATTGRRSSRKSPRDRGLQENTRERPPFVVRA